MKDFINKFIERNKPIFTIGMFTLLLFVGIIVYYRLKPRTETRLNKIGNDNTFNVVEEDKPNIQDIEQYSDTQPSVSVEQSIDERFGILDIAFTQTGFRPKIAKAVLGQAVRWINNTDKTIYLKQKTPTYADLSNLIQIDPGQAFSYRLTEEGDWNYEEDLSKYFATIEVKRVIE